MAIVKDLLVTGDVKVSGNIEGDVTGDLTGNADTATQATKDGSGNVIASTYLPLSGGTMTGPICCNSTMRIIKGYSGGSVVVDGSPSGKGAHLTLHDGTDSEYPGEFLLWAINSEATLKPYLRGTPSGYLQWGGKEVERINSSGSNYIRYENGLQLCWGEYLSSTSIPTGGTVYQAGISFPVAFSSVPNVIIGGYGDYGCSISAALNRNSRSTVYCVVEFGNWYPTTLTAQIGFSWIAIGYWK